MFPPRWRPLNLRDFRPTLPQDYEIAPENCYERTEISCPTATRMQNRHSRTNSALFTCTQQPLTCTQQPSSSQSFRRRTAKRFLANHLGVRKQKSQTNRRAFWTHRIEFFRRSSNRLH